MPNATYRMEDIGGPDLTSAATLLNAAYKTLQKGLVMSWTILGNLLILLRKTTLI